MVFNGVNKGEKGAKGVFLPFSDQNPGETITKEGFAGQADDRKKHNALRAGASQ